MEEMGEKIMMTIVCNPDLCAQDSRSTNNHLGKCVHLTVLAPQCITTSREQRRLYEQLIFTEKQLTVPEDYGYYEKCSRLNDKYVC